MTVKSETTRKPPKSWRVCPACYGRATKIFSLTTGLYLCQQCDHEYPPPNGRLPIELEVVLCNA